MSKFTYPALRIQQTETGAALVLFSAPAVDIERWSGVPQKREIEGGETTGFQRDLNDNRLKNLREFYDEPRNVIQNPLLGAARALDDGAISFQVIDDAGDAATGTLHITIEDLDSLPLLDLLRRARAELIRRVPLLGEHEVPVSRVEALKRRAVESPDLEEMDEEAFAFDEDVDSEDEDDTEDDSEESTGSVFSDESHIQDFFEEIDARIQVLDAYGEHYDRSSFLGYDKPAMVSFLQPVLIVDGQHRLKGAVDSARHYVNGNLRGRLEELVLDGMSPDEAEQELILENSRHLPVSLLLSDDPAEHVFQFVIVNQKATPIGRALLGTIVSTSLSNSELERVASRLENAGIPLEDSRSVAFLTRFPESPFFDLVERGLASDAKDHLPWTVLGGLVRIFRDLRGGRLFHSKPDFANMWRRDHLEGSAVVDDFDDRGYDTPYEYWRSPDGPWRMVFLRFWSLVRDELASTTDDEAPNFWGKARTSQIFNKISLTILAADFFKFLTEKDINLGSSSDVDDAVGRWLRGVDRTYFAREWDLRGVKKASSGISKQWAKLWAEYRVDPQRLPRKDQYRKASSA